MSMDEINPIENSYSFRSYSLLKPGVKYFLNFIEISVKNIIQIIISRFSCRSFASIKTLPKQKR